MTNTQTTLELEMDEPEVEGCESCQDGEHAECDNPKDTVCVYAGNRYGYAPEPPEYAVSDCCCGVLYTPDIADEGPDEDYVRDNDFFDDFDPGTGGW